jgi:hypothetical protein
VTLSKKTVQESKEQAIAKLKSFGIEDSFQVKIKRASKPYTSNFIGQYRAGSQFRSGPIFWVNPELPSLLAEERTSTPIATVVEDTILHEYGHVIWEYADKRDRDLMEYIKAIEPDEEDFAETFALVARIGRQNSVYRQIAEKYQESLRKQ